MNKKALITFLLTLALPIVAWAQLESVKELTLKSEYFNHERQVLIYTPGGYQHLIIHDAEHANRVYRLWERNQWMGE